MYILSLSETLVIDTISRLSWLHCDNTVSKGRNAVKQFLTFASAQTSSAKQTDVLRADKSNTLGAQITTIYHMTSRLRV